MLRQAAFTAPGQERLLIYYHLEADYAANPPKPAEIHRNMQAAADMLAAQGSRLIFLPVVGKLDLYQPYLENELPENPGLTALAAAPHGRWEAAWQANPLLLLAMPWILLLVGVEEYCRYQQCPEPRWFHGGGPDITGFLKKVGKQTDFVSGLRVTDEETVEIAEMVLDGKVNSEIVNLLNGRGVRAVGLSGKDAGLIQARKKLATVYDEGETQKVDIGYVGEVEKVDTAILEDLLDGGYTPVIAPIGVGENGESYNINADYVAAEIAGALQAEKLLLLTDIEGIYKDYNDKSSFISTLTLPEARQYIKEGVISGGMSAGAKSPYSLYSQEFVTFERDEVYNQADATGFINLFGLPLKVRALMVAPMCRPKLPAMPALDRERFRLAASWMKSMLSMGAWVAKVKMSCRRQWVSGVFSFWGSCSSVAAGAAWNRSWPFFSMRITLVWVSAMAARAQSEPL